MKSLWKEQQRRISQLSKALRLSYYRKTDNEICYYNKPHGVSGNMTESIGAWPEFIFRGTFCKRTFKGYCSPCFYSQFSLNRPSNNEYSAMVREQFDYVINNFNELVVNRQFMNSSLRENKSISFVMTPTGSFFDDYEFAQSLRIEMLEKLCHKAKEYNNRVHMLLECHCKDWNALDFTTESTKYELQLLRELNTRILFGFESVNEYVRNVLYNKHLGIDEFLMAVSNAKSFGLETGAFVFAGLFSMNDALTIQDVSKSIRYLIEQNIAPVIMFQNVQQYTINEVLFRENEIQLIEPFTVMEIILSLINIIGEFNANDIEWLIADPKGGPPVPEFNIFDCTRITNSENANSIYNMVCKLRLTRDLDEFKENAKKLMETNDYYDYKNFISNCFDENMLFDNTNKLIDIAEEIVYRREK